MPKTLLLAKNEVLLNKNAVKIAGMIYIIKIDFDFIYLNMLNIQ
ncbi:hypothetical protein [Peptoanaerobacter stomatis]|nr:hypothetical protein [Peptoanaerobacter stomatis]